VDPKIGKTLLGILLLLLIFLQCFYRLGALGLVGPDEPRYAQVAKEMASSGDFVTPRLNGKPWFEKPILYYWLTASFYRVLGVNEFSARLASALAGSLGVVVTWWLGCRWIGRRGGFLSAAILATSVIWFSLSRAATMDMLLSSALAFAWASLYAILFPTDSVKQATGSLPHHSSPLPAIILSVSLAVSVLAKGPVGVILVVGSLLLYLLLAGDFWKIKRFPFVTIGVVFAGLSVPWYWLCYQANGSIFVREFIVQHNIQRFTTDRFQHAQPIWFYLGVLFVGFFPWTLQILEPVSRLLHRKFRVSTENEAKELFFGLWLLVPLLFFSASRAKLPGYLLPVAPAVAILIAREYELHLGGEGGNPSEQRFVVLLWLQSISIVLLGIALFFFGGKLNIDIGPLVSEISLLLVGLGFLSSLLVRARQVLAFVTSCVCGIALIVVLITTQLLPRIDHLESSRQFALWLKEAGYAQRPITLFQLSRHAEYGLNFYLNSATKIIYSAKDLQGFADEKTVLILPDSLDPAELLGKSEVTRESFFEGKRIIEFRSRP
jgi:4-amino-4-deoxy-L-arabinose transferase-like glycosyltransferase